MPIPVVVVDDELHGSESLCLLIREYCPELDIRAVASNVKEAVNSCREHKPEILFLDIELPDGSGFEVMDRTRDLPYHVIFTTAYEHYALKALKMNALDYLLKPVSADELVLAVKKLPKKTAPMGQRLEEILSMLNKSSKKEKISIPSQDGFVLVDTGSIYRLEADSNYTHVFTADKKKLTISKTLKELESLLDEDQFFRIHSAHVVNLSKIEKYIKGDGGQVVLTDGSIVPVSRANKNILLLKLGL
ncbi:MAG: LytR/AlgR family response regulator transcription factor [Bacteroidia bacterium]